MASAADLALHALNDLIISEHGVNWRASRLAEAAGMNVTSLAPAAYQMRQAAFDLEERSVGARYPSISIYCERLLNQLSEKFRRFSGKVDLVIEIRVSHDRLEEVDWQTRLYCDAVTSVLEECRGEWGQCVFYGGKYEVAYGPVKRGGRHMIQITKIHVSVDVSFS